MWKIVSADVKQQEIKELVAVSFIFYKNYLQNLMYQKHNVPKDMWHVTKLFCLQSLLYIYIYIYILYVYIYIFIYTNMFFKLGFTPCKSEEPLQGVELQKKKKHRKIKVAETDMRYFARSKISKSLVNKKHFSLIW